MKSQDLLNTGQMGISDDLVRKLIKERSTKQPSRHQRRIAAGKTKAKPYKGGSVTSNRYKQLN